MNRLAPNPRSSRRGAALLISLFVVTVVAGIGIGFIQLAANTAKAQTNAVDRMRAFYLAEAGLSESFQSVRMGRNGIIGSQNIPATFGDGTVWVESAKTDDGRIWLKSTAHVGTGRATLGLIVDPIDVPLGFFGHESVVIDTTVMVDGFDSTVRSYADEVQAIIAEDAPDSAPGGATYEEDPDSEHYAGQQQANHFVLLIGETLLQYVLGNQFEESMASDGEEVQWVLTSDPIDLTDYLSPTQFSSFLEHAYAMHLAYVNDELVHVGPGSRWTPESFSEQYEGRRTAVLGADPNSPERFDVHTNRGGRIGSNGDVVFTDASAGTSYVYGSITPGTEGAVIGGGSAMVAGSTDRRATEAELDPVLVPEVATASNVSHTGSIPYVVPSGTSRFGTLHVGDDAEVIVRGPAVVVVHELTLGVGSLLTFDSRDGPIETYVTGSAVMDPASYVETTGELSDDVTIFAGPAAPTDPPPDLDLDATSRFHGTIHGPAADVRIGTNFEIFGSVVARNLRIAPGALLHFDHESFDGSMPLPKQETWRILDLPLAGIGAPVTAVALSPALGSAHDLENTTLELRYLDNTGAPQAFSGRESAFDWTDVDFIESVERNTVYLRAPMPVAAPFAFTTYEPDNSGWKREDVYAPDDWTLTAWDAEPDNVSPP